MSLKDSQNNHMENNERNDSKNILFDDLLESLGKFGRYQKFIYMLVALPIICHSFPNMMVAFTLGKHDHRCAVPASLNESYQPYGEERTLVTNNSDGEIVVETYSQCTIRTNNTDKNITTTTKCESWVYDKSVYQTTIISDFNMVCDDVILQSHAIMLYSLGAVFGCMIFMSLADVIGRKPVLCSTLILMFVFDFAAAWAPTFLYYGIFAFIYGMAGSTYLGIAVITGLELVHPSKREIAGVSIDYFWCFGEFILAGLAYWLRNWRNLKLATSSFYGLFVFYYFLIDESPRWLLAKGRNAEAHAIIRKIAKWNKVELAEDVIEAVYDPIDPNEKVTLTSACGHILRSPKVMFWVAIVHFNRFVLYLSYVGYSVNIAILGGNVYLEFLISSIVELAGYIVCYIMLNKIGRRPLLCTSMIVGGVASFCVIFTVTIAQDAPIWINITLSMIGRLGVSCAFGVIFIIEGEISPTPIRGAVGGVGSVVGLVGSMIAPYIAKINNLVETDFGNALYLIVFGVLMFGAGLAALFLPETKNRKLPDTIEEAEQLKTNDRIDKQKRSRSLDINIWENSDYTKMQQIHDQT